MRGAFELAAPSSAGELACRITCTIPLNSCIKILCQNSMIIILQICAQPEGFVAPPPGSSAHSARPTPMFKCGTPLGRLFWFVAVFYTSQKSSKIWIFQNTTPKHYKSTLATPLAAQYRFVVILASISASFWEPCFINNSMFFAKTVKVCKCFKANILVDDFVLLRAIRSFFQPPFRIRLIPNSMIRN